MRKLALTTALVAALCTTGCFSGPHLLNRTIDDWDQKTYVDSPWLNATLWIIPVIPLMKAAAFVGDTLCVDAITFWGKDAWDGKGTGFRHYEVDYTDGAMNSLLIQNGEFTQVPDQ